MSWCGADLFCWFSVFGGRSVWPGAVVPRIVGVFFFVVSCLLAGGGGSGGLLMADVRPFFWVFLPMLKPFCIYYSLNVVMRVVYMLP